MYCVGSSGAGSIVPGAKITPKVTGTDGKVYQAKQITTSFGWAGFSPQVPPETGRLTMMCPRIRPLVRSKEPPTASLAPKKAFSGVVVGANAGTVTFSSPTGQFFTFSEPVVNGAFAAPALQQIRGQVVLSFAGDRKTAERAVDKDASRYSVVLKATKARK